MSFRLKSTHSASYDVIRTLPITLSIKQKKQPLYTETALSVARRDVDTGLKSIFLSSFGSNRLIAGHTVSLEFHLFLILTLYKSMRLLLLCKNAKKDINPIYKIFALHTRPSF